jgi:hypothetical protein
MTRRITVTIDRLTLRGLPVADRQAIAAVLRDALQRHLARTDVAAFGGSRSVPLLRAKPLRMPDTASPQWVGNRVAAGIAQGVRRS